MPRPKNEAESVASPSLDHIAEGLRHLAVPLADLRPDPANARRHDERNLAAIANSLRTFGQDQPLVVQKQGMIVRKGNGRYEAARRIGWTHLAAVVVDESEVAAVASALADNRTAELAAWDDDVLASLLESVRSQDDKLAAATGFTDAEIDALLDGDEPEVKPVEVREPPKMVWVLIGVPTVRYGEIAEAVEKIAALPDVVVESTSNDG